MRSIMFNPGPGRPCWHCIHYGGVPGKSVHCLSGKGTPYPAKPEHGCCDFKREPGSDDVPEWNPLEQGSKKARM